ncbi:Regulator of G-protein signaling loco-like, partial [Homarus americanus]
MDNLPSISEVRETIYDGLSSSEETLDPDSAEESNSTLPEIRSESPLHYADCEDTGQCENCGKGSHHSQTGDEDCTSINSSCLSDDIPANIEELSEGHRGLLLDHFVTIRRDPNMRGQSFRKDKRLSMIMAAGLDPGKPPAVTSRSMEHLAVDGGVEKKWTRSNSLRRPFHSSRHNTGHQQDPSAHSDTEIGKISAPHSLLDGDSGSVGGSVSSERAIDVGRVGAWATSFEKLLEDPAGLHTFAEFLKKEYSHENIYFWTACERYKRVSNPDELRAMAKEIFERHLYSGAPEPVNVDSQARQDAGEGLHSPNQFLFDQAQKQIFNLMKFDSYSRFLKSSLYNDCVSRDMRGQTLPYPGDETLDPDLRIAQEDSHVKLKKSRSDADERRRKSLLPWNRKDRSKSKDRGEAEYRRRKKHNQRNTSDSSSIRSDISGSRTSLNSSDLPLGRRALSKESLTSGDFGSFSGSECYSRCRVILPDLSNSVVAVRNDESIQVLLTRLLERRGLSYSTFDVYQHKTDKLMDKSEDSSMLGGMEVRLEQRIIFRLDLPNRKTVCVKAKPNKVTNDVLKPILLKYGYKLDLMFVHKVGEEKGVNLKCHVNELDGDKLVVQTKEEVKEWGVESGRQTKRGTTLDEITNRVFEDLLKGKSEQNFDELGILDFDARSTRTDNSSDRSSGILGGFSRRNSLAPDKETNNKPRKPSNRSSVHENLSGRGMLQHPDHALVTKRRGNNPANVKQENDELYEGLKRAQRSRLDDQRGTEINFELPDFLKCEPPQDKENQHAHLADQLLAHLECSFSDGVVIPTHQEAEDYFSMAHPEVWGGIPSSTGPHSANATLLAPDLDLDDFDDTLRGEESLCQVPLPDTSSTSLHVDPPDFSPPPPIPMENSAVPAVSRMALTSLPLSPPPLPPKPKLGGIRGPPPRPPSRQLHLLNPPTFTSTSDDDALHSSDPPIHITRQNTRTLKKHNTGVPYQTNFTLPALPTVVEIKGCI